MATFSKLLFPAVRLGFLIVPPQLSGAFAFARWLNDRCSPPLTQMVLHRFIESGQFLKHVRKMRTLYRERQQFLYDSLIRVFAESIEVSLPESGMHLTVKGTSQRTEQRLMNAAQRAGVEFHSVSTYCQERGSERGLILGFAAFDETTTRKALRNWRRQFEK